MNEQNRKDISILVIDKAASPRLTLRYHTLLGLALDLHRTGFNVDIIWSIADWASFDLKKKTEAKKEIKKEIAGQEDEPDSYWSREKLDAYELLREKPICSIDDLASYRFIIPHVDVLEWSLIKDFMKKYSGIPVITIYYPDRSLSGTHPTGKKLPVPNTYKDDQSFYQVERVIEGDETDTTTGLIKYLLEQQEKQEAVKKR